MGYEDVCNVNTDLSLGLALLDKPEIEFQPHHLQEKKNLSPKFDHFPSLTFGLSSEGTTYQTALKIEASKVHGENSNSSVKEREVSHEEIEIEKASSRVSSDYIQDHDQEGCARKKLRLTKEQSNILEDSFKENSTLNPKQKQALAKNLNLRPRQVEVWFQNRRARTKLKQTEEDSELLKKCCEALTDENTRLQNELQELRRLKLSAPCYMQLPTPVFTICPRCERIAGGGENSSKSPFPIGTRSHLACQTRFSSPFILKT